MLAIFAPSGIVTVSLCASTTLVMSIMMANTITIIFFISISF